MVENLIGQQTEEDVDSNIAHLLKIIRENLHLDPFTPVREYIANSRDATRDVDDPRISVWGVGSQLHVQDNGRGMTRKVIVEGFTRIGGHVDTQAFHEVESIGQFGLGCKSAFMAALRLVVETRSLDEPHGWRIEWERDATHYKLTPIERDEVGTHAVLHLEADKKLLASNSQLKGKIARVFAVLPMPIHLGNSEPINPHWKWVVDQSRARKEPRLLLDRESLQLLEQFSLETSKVAYTSIDDSGTRVLLGIPDQDNLRIDGHKISLFSKGVLVQGSEMNFFPESLSFVVGIIDCPGFKVQLDKEVVGKDEVYDRVRDSMESQILTFLELIGKSNPGLMEEILRVHRTKLMSHAREAPELRSLFREHYRFDTSAGRILWKDIVGFASERISDHGGRTIHVLNSSQGEEYLSESRSKGLLTVFAVGTEFELLKEIANEAGVTVVLASEMGDTEDLVVPPPFRKLGARLGVKLNYRGSWGLTFVNLSGDNTKPALFRVKTVRDGKIGDRDSTEGQTMISVDALMINVAHPLVRRLAGMVDELSEAQISAAADVLFQSAVLNSRFRDAAASISDDVIANLTRMFGSQLDRSDEITTAPDESGPVRCFFALPFRDEFFHAFDGADRMLGEAPYSWELIRADHHVAGVGLLANLLNMIKTGHRFLADISGLNPNVMIELGMMLRQDRHATVILCDRETYDQGIPTDLKGEIFAIYDAELRNSPERFEAWFRAEIWKFSKFLAITSPSASPRRNTKPQTQVLTHV